MALLRPSLEDAVASSADLDGVSDGRSVEIAGMVVARQRPATARGVVFMLLEDELGTINVVVPPPVYRRHRLAVRTASFAQVSGKLERRAGVVNVVASAVRPIATPDQPRADVRHIEPPAERETGRRIAGGDADRAGALSAGQAAELAAVAPAAHSFGRRAAMTLVQVPLQNVCSVRPPSYLAPHVPQAHRPRPADSRQRRRSRDRLRDAGRVRPRAGLRGRVLS